MRSKLLMAAIALLALGGCGGPDAEQIIGKDPVAVYAAFEQALAQSDVDGTVGGDGKAVPYTVELAKTPNEQLGIKVLIDGQQAGVVTFTFAPHDGGAHSRVTGDIDVDLTLLDKYFGTTPDNRVAGVPALAWNSGLRRMLRTAADRIEHGAPIDTGPQLLTKSLDSGI